jgi:hypothetical protein
MVGMGGKPLDSTLTIDAGAMVPGSARCGRPGVRTYTASRRQRNNEKPAGLNRAVLIARMERNIARIERNNEGRSTI